MFTASVDTLERLFVQKAYKTVLFSNLFHKLHCEHIGIDRYVRSRENRRHFVLCRSDLVVFRLGKYSVAPKLLIQIAHKFADLGFDYAEIMVFEFLTSRGGRAEKSSARKTEVFAL